MRDATLYTDRDGATWTVTRVARLRALSAGARAPTVTYVLRLATNGQECFVVNVPPRWRTRKALTRLFELAKATCAGHPSQLLDLSSAPRHAQE